MPAGRLKSAGRVAAPETPHGASLHWAATYLARRLEGYSGAAPDTEVAATLEAIGRLGPAAAPATVPALMRVLPERSPLWRDRDKLEVVRLRAFVLATLARLGPPPDEALPYVLAELSGAKSAYALAAAARAAGALGPRAAAAVPYLQRPLAPGFHDEPLSLERYDPEFPEAERTTARQEALRALELIGPAAAPSSVATPWLPPARRPVLRSLGIPAVDQDGEAVTLAALADRPLALAFFYARCDNPNRCSLVTSSLARLQREVAAAGLAGKVRIVLATFEPEADTPAVLKRYGLDRGFAFDGTARILRPDPAGEARLLDELAAPVNFSGGWVNVHGLALHLIDGRGRWVRTYHGATWDDADVLADFRRLLSE